MNNSNLEDLIYYNKLEKYKYSKQDAINKFNNNFKYRVIRKLPYLFIIFIFVLILLIYLKINILNNDYVIIIDIFIQLFIGLNIAVFGVYLWSVKSEYYNILDNLLEFKKQLNNHLEIKNVKDLYKNIL